MNHKQIDSIEIPGGVNEDAYTALKNYLAYLPVEVGGDDYAHVRIIYKAKDVDDSKIVIITPNRKSFSNVSVKTNRLDDKKFEFSFYANDALNFRWGDDEIIIEPYNRIDEREKIRSKISELEERLKTKS